MSKEDWIGIKKRVEKLGRKYKVNLFYKLSRYKKTLEILLLVLLYGGLNMSKSSLTAY